ncbi:hypothetical protein EN885_17765 [Mesorhizobium sp. M6A.T.Cr.TU.014.01.1.1]|nr:hypothetical protein EN885_17765 [Mesorhizobium sp. M6A.T.Cr.TU.014.01.1.1]RWP76941.1 MAG: hypothetical protein EOR10_16895 [Mesorhizobium sp.]RWP99524.1 MAG: hypothetical protein EOR90_24210 [Mesorhizobium sp.]RWQ03918.1 MAG: hypothetical protein EOR91_17950 [Mesorhizobium sp.]
MSSRRSRFGSGSGAPGRQSLQPLLPVTIRGEVPGRAMRGGADFNKIDLQCKLGTVICLKRFALTTALYPWHG